MPASTKKKGVSRSRTASSAPRRSASAASRRRGATPASSSRRSGARSTASARTSKKAAQKVKEGAARPASAARELPRKAAVKAGKLAVRRAVKSVRHGVQDWLPQLGETARELAGGLPGNGGSALAERVRRLPIQRSIDIAVPLELAWDEWTRLDSLPEGMHHVEEIERDGDGRLTGRVSGIRLDGDWEADVLDEREDESFAWRSVHGSDCAGLVTFHRLGPRLTRLELQLDVVPRRVAEAVALLLHLADRRADADLKRFKARLETINPDEYPEADDDEAPGEGEEE